MTASALFVTAQDLQTWSQSIDASLLLPLVVRRLVYATTPDLRHYDFPAGEGIRETGLDGITTADAGTVFVPSGAAAWELSVEKSVGAKANKDYESRTANPLELNPAETAFVFVTARAWRNKRRWAAEKTGDGIWREVRAYDAHNLEQWLDLAPGVALWLSEHLGKAAIGARDVRTFFDEWSRATEPSLTPSFLLAGRSEVAGEIQERVKQRSGILSVQAESRSEATVVVAAALSTLPEDEGERALSRTIVVEDVNAWRRLSRSTTPLILIPLFDGGDEIPAAVRAGHGVIIPLGAGDPSTQSTQRVPRINRGAGADALVATGVPRERANDIAAMGHRGITALRRSIALSPSLRVPSWSTPAAGRALRHTILVGAWNDEFEGDKEAVEAISGVSYEAAREESLNSCAGSDALLRHSGSAWYLVNRLDAWKLLRRFLTKDDLNRFAEVATVVLTTPNPAFDLQDEERWMAGILGERPKYSGLLCRAIADTLAVMTTSVPEDPAIATIVGGCVFRVVRDTLAAANEDWRVWASLESVLHPLAEAEPDVFLDAVEKGLQGDSPVLQKLFTDSDDGLFSSSPHTGLLWALESLAWSPGHLGRVVLSLARLSEVDPGGQLVNRPKASLSGIFRPWLPQTSAKLDRRLQVLDSLRERAPDIAWEVLLSMLPEHHGVAFPASRPSWRDWAPDDPARPSRQDYDRAINEVVSRLLTDVGRSGTRWASLIEALPRVSAEDHARILERISNLNPAEIESQDSAIIWAALRDLVAKHRAFPDASWAMPGDMVDRIEAVRGRFEPSDPAARYAWLFSHHPDLPEGRPKLGEDWDDYFAEVERQRSSALGTVADTEGSDGVIAIARAADDAGSVGATAAGLPSMIASEDALLSSHLASTEAKLAEFAYRFALRRSKDSGEQWASDKLQAVGESWSPTQRAHILLALPANHETWQFVASTDPACRDSYWGLLGAYGIADEDVCEAVGQLLGAQRPNAAVTLLALRKHVLTSCLPLVFQALHEAGAANLKRDAAIGSFTYHVAELLDVLGNTPNVDQSELARLEWRWLPVLDIRHHHEPKALHALLAADPAFFVEAITFVFRAEDEARHELSEEEKERHHRGYALLQSWRRVPGTMQDGGVDSDVLQAWVNSARSRLEDVGRLAIGDQMIGQMLSGSGLDPDDSWPVRAVRNVIETSMSNDLEKGFEIGLYNSRGVVTKNPDAGGDQERSLASKYLRFSEAVADQWPRTAAVLRGIADTYRRDAAREDLESDLHQDLGR